MELNSQNTIAKNSNGDGCTLCRTPLITGKTVFVRSHLVLLFWICLTILFMNSLSITEMVVLYRFGYIFCCIKAIKSYLLFYLFRFKSLIKLYKPFKLLYKSIFNVFYLRVHSQWYLVLQLRQCMHNLFVLYRTRLYIVSKSKDVQLCIISNIFFISVVEIIKRRNGSFSLRRKYGSFRQNN